MTLAGTRVILFSASGVETRRRNLQRARQRLTRMGFEVVEDESTRHRYRRFAGTDEQRLATVHRVADQVPSVALATRGGYGITRLLDDIDWRRIRRSVERGTRWVGYSDMTAFSLALFANTEAMSWHGPMAAVDFGRELGQDSDEDAANAVTCDCFQEALTGVLEALGFRTDSGFDGLSREGILWGGNLSMVCSLLGTRHWPDIRGGLLFLEDVGEHPYRVERMLLQLHQSGVLASQSAILLGCFNGWTPSPLDRGYTLTTAFAHLQREIKVPMLRGLPIGHTPLNMTLPQGRRTALTVSGRTAMLHWT